MDSQLPPSESNQSPELSRREMLGITGITTGVVAGVGGGFWYVVTHLADNGRAVPVEIVKREKPLSISYLNSVTARVDDDFLLGPLSFSLTLTDWMVHRPLERIDIYSADGINLATTSPEGTHVSLFDIEETEVSLPVEYILVFRLPDGAGERTRLAELVRIRLRDPTPRK